MPQYSEATFFMKEIVVHSKKHGNVVALVDDEDFEMLSKFHWWRGGNRKQYAYQSNSIGNRRYRHKAMHRMIMGYPDSFIDHRDGNGFDNRKENLRLCTQRQNTWNKSVQHNSKTGFRGVFFQKELGKFRALIRIDGKQKHIGCFSNAIDAAIAWNNQALKSWGEYARLNKIPCAVE
jgi:hypothetical protein